MYIAVIIVVILAVPAILAARLAAAKRRERRLGSPSTFTRSDEAAPATEHSSNLENR